ncbi:cytochrome c [Roseomonas sp. CAU 1739]|uniref:c-type cytochrome n=1 Tax=Roseomonas sp. CAU 1739 TaxID=3140364 RepID=UPI00325ADE57
MKRFWLGFCAAAVLLVAAGVIVAFTGIINVAASVPHSALERWYLTTTMTHSVRRRAADIAVPDRITDQDIRRGFAQYRDSCVYCHGAPGVDATDWAQALQPEPPYLADAVPARQPAELFWIIRNGIKMTAMPAFGRHLNDRDVWGVVGFIRLLPGMSDEAYARLAEEAERAAPAPDGTAPPARQPSN